MVNKIVDWFKKRERKLMIFKIDFEKACDSISQDFIELVMVILGFRVKWVSWIRVALVSAKASVLENGSPSYDYNLERGLRQGDSFSLFLFILVRRLLHVVVEDVIDVGFVKAAKIGNMMISHFIYGDDNFFWLTGVDPMLLMWCSFWSVSMLFLGKRLICKNVTSRLK